MIIQILIVIHNLLSTKQILLIIIRIYCHQLKWNNGMNSELLVKSLSSDSLTSILFIGDMTVLDTVLFYRYLRYKETGFIYFLETK